MLCTNTDLDTLISRLDEDTTETPYLILGGFQSIRLPAALPIRPISLLYGPNSSGKSAISDALRYLEWEPSSKEWESSFDRWLNIHSEEIAIGFSWLGNLSDLIRLALWRLDHFHGDSLEDLAENLDGTVSESTFSESPFEETSPCRLTWLIRDERLSERWSDQERTVELYARGTRVATLVLGLQFSAGFDVYRSGIEQLGISEANVRWLWNLFKRVGIRSNPLDENEFHIFEDDSECLHVDWADLTRSARPFDERPRLFMASFHGHDPHWMDNVSDLMKILFSRPALGIRADNLALGPIRPMPGESELRFLCQDTKAAISLDSRSGDANYIFQVLADDIAEEALAEKLNRKNIDPKGLLADVNRWLNDESFFGMDYRLQADVSEIVSLASDDATNRILVEFWLRNGVGKKLSFDDVGTGFFQVIPVIIYALKGDQTIFVEQPELHLHPRVQHRLADLFIESIRRERCGFCIIETHSEHIALRVMRRIRETGRSDIPHSRWSIKPEEVSVLYFEPEGGQTYIHELRIDGTGEFIDKWPRGFFEERYEDLFDVPRMGD
jgi:hypothetical protein